jgi:hypothetical protein
MFFWLPSPEPRPESARSPGTLAKKSTASRGPPSPPNKKHGRRATHILLPTAMCRRPIGLNVAVIGALLAAVVAGAPRAGRRLQDVCRCKHCVKAGNTAQQCMAFGIDCSCLVVCKCQACLDKGNSVKLCQSFGLDCAGCDDTGSTGSGDTCGKGKCRDDPTWISSFHAACADLAPTGMSAGHCATASGADTKTGATRLATDACPVTCGTCPPTFAERQIEVTAKCCGADKNCGPGHIPVSCSEKCYTTFLSFWDECHDDLLTKYQYGISKFDGIVAKCQATSKACAPAPCQNGAVCSAKSAGSQACKHLVQKLCAASRRSSVGNCQLCVKHYATQVEAVCDTTFSADKFCQAESQGGHFRHLQQASADFACTCLANYYGSTCAKFCTSSTTCSGKGRCRQSDGECSCQKDYYGPSCSTFCSADITCSGHGFCGSDGRCDCQGGFTKDKHCRGAEHKAGHGQYMHSISVALIAYALLAAIDCVAPQRLDHGAGGAPPV